MTLPTPWANGPGWPLGGCGIDGSYQGCYLLCEKVQVGTNRVELEQEDGILAEADNIYYNGEEYWFTGNQSGTHFTLKRFRRR